MTRSAEAVNNQVHLPPAPRQWEGLKAEEVKRGEEEERWRRVLSHQDGKKQQQQNVYHLPPACFCRHPHRRLAPPYSNLSPEQPQISAWPQKFISHVCPVRVLMCSTNKPAYRSTWLPLSLAVWTIGLNLVKTRSCTCSLAESERVVAMSGSRANLAVAPPSARSCLCHSHYATPHHASNSHQVSTKENGIDSTDPRSLSLM